MRTVPGVADAQPFLEGYGQLLGRDGKPIGGNGPPTQAANWVGDPALNPYRLVAGHAPRAADEVVINRGAAKTGHLALGMTTTLLTPQPLRVHIVGIATFGTADGFGPGTFTGMTLPAAQLHLTGPRGPGPGPAQLSQILVRAAPGVPDAELAARLRPVLPAGVQAITGAQLATENLDDINSGFLGFLSTGLTAFAAIALLVAAFSIYNTFSILAAQRGRESALLRALGGTRRQLAVAGLAETLVIGVVGSVAGWAGGIGIAALLKGVFDGFGFALPAGGLVLRASSSVLAVAVGVAATVLAGVLPALRASRVPPLAALRELAAEPARISRVRSVLGFLLTAGGVGGRDRRHRRRRPGARHRGGGGDPGRVRGPRPGRGPAGRGRAGRADRRAARRRRAAGPGQRAAQPAADRGHRVGADGRGGRGHLVHRDRGVAEGERDAGRRPHASRRPGGLPAWVRRQRRSGRVQPDARGRPGPAALGRCGGRGEPGQRAAGRPGPDRRRGRPGPHRHRR